MRERYTEEQKQFLLQHGADLPTKDLTAALNERFGTAHSERSVLVFAKRLGVRKSAVCRSINCARSGEPIGTTKIVGGYRYVKVRMSGGGWLKDWRREIQIEYEKANGPIPSGYQVVTLDGNKLNASPENLCAIPRSIAARMMNGRGKSRWSEFPEVTRTAIEVCKLDEAIKAIK